MSKVKTVERALARIKDYFSEPASIIFVGMDWYVEYELEKRTNCTGVVSDYLARNNIPIENRATSIHGLRSMVVYDLEAPVVMVERKLYALEALAELPDGRTLPRTERVCIDMQKMVAQVTYPELPAPKGD